MVKTKTLPKQKKSSKNTSTLTLKKNAKVIAHNPTKALLDEDRLGRAIWECLKNNDPAGVVEVIEIYLDAVNKSHTSTDFEKEFKFKAKNPTVKTLASVVHDIQKAHA